MPPHRVCSAMDGSSLTGQLFGALRYDGGGLAFAQGDIERFRDLGVGLSIEGLSVWLRELGILVVTLRDDVHALGAAVQLERELIDPLCVILDHKARARAGVRLLV